MQIKTLAEQQSAIIGTPIMQTAYQPKLKQEISSTKQSKKQKHF
jgi:hypothetical protein